MASLYASDEREPNCRPEEREKEGNRCAWAQLIIANIAAAQVEKVPVNPRVLPGEPLVFELALANLTSLPVEWFDAVDILPREGEPRSPETSLSDTVDRISVTIAPGGAPLYVWASAIDPDTLDTMGNSPHDGLLDPVAAWGAPGGGLGSPRWPCLLSAVNNGTCTEIPTHSDISALRFWGPDPSPSRAGTASTSFLPPDLVPRRLLLEIHVPGTVPGDLAHNAWGGRFEGLPLPVFDKRYRASASARYTDAHGHANADEYPHTRSSDRHSNHHSFTDRYTHTYDNAEPNADAHLYDLLADVGEHSLRQAGGRRGLGGRCFE